MDKGIISILVLLVMLSVLLFFYYRQKTKQKIGLYLIIEYLITGICSLFFYKEYGDFSGFYNITIGPFFIWIVCFVILLVPVYIFDRHTKVTITYNIKIINRIGILCLFLSVLPIIEFLPRISSMVSNFDNFYYEISDIHDEDAKDYALSFISTQLYRVARWFYYLSFLLVYPLMTDERRNKWALVGVISLIISFTLPSIISVSRNNLYQLMICLLASFGLLRSLLSKKLEKKIKKSGIIVFSLIITIFAIITITRSDEYSNKDDGHTMEYFLLRYSGEGFLNYNQYAFDVKEYANGEITMYFPRYVLGLETNMLTREYFYNVLEPRLGIPLNVFYTIIGVFMTDIGPYFSILFFAFVSLLLSRIIQSGEKEIPLSTVFLLFLLVIALSFGNINYLFISTGSQLLFINFVIAYILKVNNS